MQYKRADKDSVCNCFFLSFTSLAELEKEVYSIKSGLKALEAVSCNAFVSCAVPLVLLLSVITLWSRAELGSRVRCLNAGDADTERRTSHLQPHTETRAYVHAHM